MRAELAKEARDGATEEALQVREIKSTLPPMKLDISPISPWRAVEGRALPRETKSAEAVPVRRVGEAATHHQAPAYAGMAAEVEGVGEGELQMTFETSFADACPQSEWTDDAPNHPAMKTSQTMPNVTLTGPWGDAEDDEFGQEKEISMQFA
ncbi:hypothetical protein G6O67_006978 [Ophiocordyceps sinensis]|nr:hypothetical protein G6O67_006978 [Ophiocordyceps sinensis]